MSSLSISQPSPAYPVTEYLLEKFHSPLLKKITIISAVSIAFFSSFALATTSVGYAPHLIVIFTGDYLERKLKHYALNINSFSLFKTTLIVSMVAFGAAWAGMGIASLIPVFTQGNLAAGIHAGLLTNFDLMTLLFVAQRTLTLTLSPHELSGPNRLKVLLQNIYQLFTNPDWDAHLREMFNSIRNKEEIEKYLNESSSNWIGYIHKSLFDDASNFVNIKTEAFRKFIQNITNQSIDNAENLEKVIKDIKTWQNLNAKVNLQTLETYRKTITLILEHTSDPEVTYNVLWKEITSLIVRPIALTSNSQNVEFTTLFTIPQFLNLLNLPLLEKFNKEKFLTFGSLKLQYEELTILYKELSHQYNSFSNTLSAQKAQFQTVANFPAKIKQELFDKLQSLSLSLCKLQTKFCHLRIHHTHLDALYIAIVEEKLEQIEAYTRLKAKGFTPEEFIFIHDNQLEAQTNSTLFEAIEDTYKALSEKKIEKKKITKDEIENLITTYDFPPEKRDDNFFLESHIENQKINALNKLIATCAIHIENDRSHFTAVTTSPEEALNENAYTYLVRAQILKLTSTFENLKEALEMKELDEDVFSDALAKIGLKNVSDLQTQKIIAYSSEGKISNKTTCENLITFIQKNTPPPTSSPCVPHFKDRWVNKITNITSHLSDSLSTLSNKVSGLLFTLIQKSLILVPMLIFPQSTAVAITLGVTASLFTLVVFGKPTLKKMGCSNAEISNSYLRGMINHLRKIYFFSSSKFQRTSTQRFIEGSLPLKLFFLILCNLIYILKTQPFLGYIPNFIQSGFLGREMVLKSHTALKRTWTRLQPNN